MEMTYLCVYRNYERYLAPYRDEERGRLLYGLLHYLNTGEAPEFEGPEKYLWPVLQDQCDRDREAYVDKCAQNRANGAKGGRPKKQEPEPEGFSEKPEKPKEKKKEKEKEKKKKNETDPPSGGGGGAGFDLFWESYPRKTGKQEAMKAFARVKVPLDTLLNALEIQRRSDQWVRDGGRYIPYPATWLNQARWEDDPGACTLGRNDIPSMEDYWKGLEEYRNV